MIIEDSNLLSVTTGVIAHQVNCQGVMGSGVAQQLRSKYPEVYEVFNERTRRSEPSERLGKVDIIPIGRDLTILNIYGQFNYGRDGKCYTNYKAVEQAFHHISWAFGLYKEHTTIHIPYMMGCGLAGGNWETYCATLGSFENLDFIAHRI